MLVVMGVMHQADNTCPMQSTLVVLSAGLISVVDNYHRFCGTFLTYQICRFICVLFLAGVV